ncbi:MAG: BTB/POZ protein [Benjaminiella poitrasii]|nr:MAG: BTB/POZ protein [Benjaminiella poitrasii]
MLQDNRSILDPIEFFDQLAATSSRREEIIIEPKTLLNSRSLETVKPSSVKTDNHNSKDFQEKWIEVVKSYKKEKQTLIQHLSNQLTALEEIDDDFDKANIELHNKVENSFYELSKSILTYQEQLYMEKQQFEYEKELIKEIRKFQEEKVKLNVGGQLFETSLSTLRKDPNSILATMFGEDGGTITPDADNSYFIDRDGTYFRLILNYLRDLKIPSGIMNDPKIMDELMQEAQFYRIKGLMKLRSCNLSIETQEELQPQNIDSTAF